MVVGEVARSVDVVVIGGGPGGYAVAAELGAAGRQVMLIEAEAIGGVCLNVGCIPSKMLIQAAEVVQLASESHHGIELEARVELARIVEQSRRTIASLGSGVSDLLKRSRVETVTGTARFSRPGRLAVETAEGVTHLEPAHTVLATGSRPLVPGELAIDGDRVLDSTGALALDELPARLAVVGGGYIGVELGTAFARLGSRVHLVEAADRLLPAMDPLLGRAVTHRLRQLRAEISTRTRVLALDEQGLLVEGPGGTESIPADRVLVAVGRRPRSDDLGLNDVALDEAGHLLVDGAGRVLDTAGRTSDRLWALGDLTPGPALAHKATAEARVVASNLAGRPTRFDALIPEVVFSDPEVASVGHTPASAAASQIAASTTRLPLTAIGRAAVLGRRDGQIQLVADEAGTLIGAQMAGPQASELVAVATLAIEAALTVEDLAATVWAHPTLAEQYGELTHRAASVGRSPR